MSIIDRFFGGKEPLNVEDWKVLNQTNQLDEIIEISFQKPVVIFKHSISCGISAMAKHQLEHNWTFDAADLDFYYLDLINHRAISNKIETQFGVYHQSPQLIVVKNGEAIFNTSHHRVNMEVLKKAILENKP